MSTDPDQEDSVLASILRRRRRTRVVQSLVAALLLLGAGVFLARRAEPPPEPAPTAGLELPAPPIPPPPPPPPERIEPPAPLHTETKRKRPLPPLPRLDRSDALVRQNARALASQPGLERWLGMKDLVRRFVVTVDNLAEGKTPKDHLDALAPAQPFAVIRKPSREYEEERYAIDPASWARYDPLVEAFISLDVERTIALYRWLDPLFAQAYRELGYPDGRFESTLFEAIDELLRTPTGVGVDEVPLRRKVLGYAYVDPALEELSAAQKQLLRTGPGNVGRVQRRLREFARALGADEAELARSPRYRMGHAP